MLHCLINLHLDRKVLWLSLLVGNFAFAQVVSDSKTTGGGNLSNTAVVSFVFNQRQALDVLTSGTTRLDRLCAVPLKPQTDKPTAQGLSDLRNQIQDRAQRIGASAERSVSLTQFALTSAQQDSQQACSPLNRMKALLGAAPADLPSCDSTKKRLEFATSLNKAAKEWLQIHDERQRLFAQLIQLESAGCTRAGFAQRMVQTHERSLSTFEDQALDMFESALRKEAPAPVSKP
jgi:hypothetical protein